MGPVERGKMSNLFFTSDTHWGHANIIKYCSRPFKSVEEMDDTLIKNWNHVVKPGDTVYHLGDFAFYKDQKHTRNVIRALNGNIVLIRGNHDKYLEPETLRAFNSVHPYYELNVSDKDNSRGKQRIILLHFAMRVWDKSHHGSWHLYGHSHGTLRDENYDKNSLSFDVGTDCHGFAPISYDRVKQIMATRTFKPIDHHGE